MRHARILFALLAIVAACSGSHAMPATAQVTPTSIPTIMPTTAPTTAPTTYPTTYPTTAPTTIPGYAVPVPTTYPTTAPTTAPTTYPTTLPTAYPTSFPTSYPTVAPTTYPTTYPTSAPTSYPTVLPGTPPPTAAPISTPVASSGFPQTIAQTHIPTFDYLETLAFAQNCAAYAPYLTYVYPKGDQFKTWHACGVKTIDYMTPSMPQSGSSENEYTQITTSYADVAAKDCNGNTLTTYSGKGELFDPHAANALAYYQKVIDDSFAYIAKYNNGVVPDMIFSDNSDSIYGSSSQPCTWKGQADWSAATANVLGQLNTHGAQLVLNALAMPTAYTKPPADDTIANFQSVIAPPSVTGGMLEGWIWSNRNASGYLSASGQPASAWQAHEDMAIATVNAGKLFNAYTNMNFASLDSTSAAGIAARTYIYASLLLTYDPDHILFAEWSSNDASGFHAVPEEGLVALYPVQTAKADVTELLRGSVYVREFRACYYRGSLIGPCAAIVNPSNTSTVSVSLPQYAHSMTLSGSDVLDGGTAQFTGPPVTSLPPNNAAILFP